MNRPLPPNCITVDQLIDNMEAAHPGFKDQLEKARIEMEQDGTLARFHNKENWDVEDLSHLFEHSTGMSPSDKKNMIDSKCCYQDFIDRAVAPYKGAPVFFSCPCRRCNPTM